MTEGKLVFLPKGCRVVPEEFLAALEKAIEVGHLPSVDIQARALLDELKATTQLTAPPVLRWEGKYLKFMDATLCSVTIDSRGLFYFTANGSSYGEFTWRDEARRAAEKSLGFPEWLVVEEV